MTEKRRILFIHPDLGIGGAERLVVDAACGLQRNGHQIGIWTSHHDPNHAFPETNSELNVRVVGDWLPRHFWKKGHALCAILRSLYLAIVLIWHVHVEFNHYDLMIVDQVSASIPLLRLTNTKILFYCHFPDQLLTQRTTLLKKIYRFPLDMFEQLTTKMADKVVVNSKFTSGIFSKTFQWISTEPEVLYPGIQLEAYDKSVDMNDEDVKGLVIDGDFVLSVNRFERKKNIQLAISAFSTLKQRMKSRFDKLALVIAGGYDHRVVENVEYLTELDQLAQELKLSTFIWKRGSKIPQKTQVIFIPSFSENQRTFLFKEALCLVYTPSHEHFGIVPVEAMYAGLPVVAVNNGGPTETVVDGKTGKLSDSDKDAFGESMYELLLDGQKAKVGKLGRNHVKERFSMAVFVRELEAVVESTIKGSNEEALVIYYTLVVLVCSILPLTVLVLIG